MNVGSLLNMFTLASLVTNLLIWRLIWRMQHRFSLVGPAIYFSSEIVGSLLVLLSSLSLSLGQKLFFFNFIFPFFLMGSCGWYLWFESLFFPKRPLARKAKFMMGAVFLLLLYVCIRTWVSGPNFFVVDPEVRRYWGYPFLVYKALSIEAKLVVMANNLLILPVLAQLVLRARELKLRWEKSFFLVLGLSIGYLAIMEFYYINHHRLPFLNIFDVVILSMLFVKIPFLCWPTSGIVLDMKLLERYKLLDKIQQGLLVTDEEGNVLDFNKAGEATLQLAAGSPISLRRSSLWQLLGDIFRGFEVEAFLEVERECLVERGSSDPLLFELELQKFTRGGRSQYTRYILLIRDITEHRSHQFDSLKFRAAFYATDDIMLICSPDGRVEHVSSGFSRTTGYMEAEVRGRFLFNINAIGPEMWGEIAEAASLGQSWAGEVKVLHKDGGEIWGQMTVSPAFDSEGRLTSLVIVSKDITGQRLRNEQLRREAHEDFLTQIYNRRTFLLLAQDRLNMAGEGVSKALLMMDLDRFKRVNDTYGHAAGDEVLKAFAQLIKKLIRKDDLFARYGGEEFVLLFCGLSEEVALRVAERIRKKVESMALSYGEVTLRITVSIGVRYTRSDEPLEELLRKADEALYAAKDAGRNRVRLWRAEGEGLFFASGQGVWMRDKEPLNEECNGDWTT